MVVDRVGVFISYCLCEMAHVVNKQSARYTWGRCVLAHLYQELYIFALESHVKGLGFVTLLHVWLYEHIAMI